MLAKPSHRAPSSTACCSRTVGRRASARRSASCSPSRSARAASAGAGCTLLDAATLLPLISPPFTTSISFIFSFGPRGLITHELLGLANVSAYGFWSTLAAETLTYFPIAYLTLRPVLAAIDRNLEEMAFSLGGSRWRIFRTVTLPLAVPGFANAFLLLFAASLADFATPLILAGNSFPVLPTQAYLQITGLFDFKGGAVLSLLLLVPAAAVYLLQRNWVGAAHLRHGHRQGRASARARSAIAPWAGARCWSSPASRSRAHPLFLCAAALRLAGRGVRRQPQLDLAHYQRDLHRRPQGDPRHADHRADRHAARRLLRRAGRLSDRAASSSPAGARWRSCR